MERINFAVQTLCKSERGKRAMHDALAMLDNGAIGLDAGNQAAILVLLKAAWGAHPDTARNAMRMELGLI